jgi:hypothetical protein
MEIEGSVVGEKEERKRERERIRIRRRRGRKKNRTRRIKRQWERESEMRERCCSTVSHHITPGSKQIRRKRKNGHNIPLGGACLSTHIHHPLHNHPLSTQSSQTKMSRREGGAGVEGEATIYLIITSIVLQKHLIRGVPFNKIEQVNIILEFHSILSN